MARILVWLAIIALVWWLIRPRTRSPGSGGASPRGADDRGEAMVDCARCGLHLPASEAVRDAAGRAYCGDEHRLAGPR